MPEETGSRVIRRQKGSGSRESRSFFLATAETLEGVLPCRACASRQPNVERLAGPRLLFDQRIHGGPLRFRNLVQVLVLLGHAARRDRDSFERDDSIIDGPLDIDGIAPFLVGDVELVLDVDVLLAVDRDIARRAANVCQGPTHPEARAEAAERSQPTRKAGLKHAAETWAE